LGKKLRIAQDTKKLMGANINMDEYFGLGEFYKMPKKKMHSNVSVDQHFNPEI
jgi:hypothetical protein